MTRIALVLFVGAGFLKSAIASETGSGKTPSDSEITKLLIGRWRFEPGRGDPPIRMALTFTKEQTCSIEAESVDMDHKRKGTGTWKVEKAEIVITVTESTEPDQKGKVVRAEVVSINDASLSTIGFIANHSGAPAFEGTRPMIVFRRIMR
jgi:hypothetical protein